MKKSLLLSTVLLGSLFLSATTVNAIEGPDKEDVTASVELTAAKDPSKPYEGLLEINKVFNLNFGSAKIGTTASILDTNNEGNPLGAAESQIIIDDIRGKSAGWNLKVGLGEFKEIAAGEDEKEAEDSIFKLNGNKLKGVKLFYPTVTPVTTADGTGLAPVTAAADTGLKVGSVKTGLTVNAAQDGAQVNSKVLMNAAVGNGDGRWISTYDKATDPVELLIAPGNKVGKYQATLTYTLTDTPEAPVSGE